MSQLTVHHSCIELPLTDVKKQYSENLFYALCSYSKYLCQRPTNDYGVDLKIEKLFKTPNGANTPGPELLAFQVKSSENWENNGTCIKYKLENKTYNSMVHRNINGLNPLILILCCLQKKHEDWVSYDAQTNIYTNFYWYTINELEYKENQSSSTTIHIPEDQRFKDNTITELIDRYEVQPNFIKSDS